MAVPFFQVSRDAARALEVFSDEFRSALTLGEIIPWAGQLGFEDISDALKTTYPIPLDAAGYHELKGDIKFRDLYHRSLSMKGKEWSDGVKAKAKVVEAPDFGNWAGQPAAMAAEWLRLPNKIVADMLALSSYNGPLLDFYRDSDSNTASTRRLFASDHPFNVLKTGLGSWDNTIDVTEAQIRSGDAWDLVENRFRSVMGPNGKPLGLRFVEGGHVLAPSTRSTLMKKSLEQDTLIQVVSSAGAINTTSSNVAAVAQTNNYKSIGYTIGDELNSQDYLYALAAGRPGLFPWIVQRNASPEEVLHDKSSELYKNSREIGIAYVGEANAGACLPHPIIRLHITG